MIPISTFLSSLQHQTYVHATIRSTKLISTRRNLSPARLSPLLQPRLQWLLEQLPTRSSSSCKDLLKWTSSRIVSSTSLSLCSSLVNPMKSRGTSPKSSIQSCAAQSNASQRVTPTTIRLSSARVPLPSNSWWTTSKTRWTWTCLW